MEGFTEKDYKAFAMFENSWALVTAGSPERFNGCTVGWGCLGTLWNRPVVTVYLHPARYTCEFLQENECFTVSFFPESCKKALLVMGSRSGRDGDKLSAAGLSPVALGDSVGYKEASLSFLCRKLYQHQFDREELAPEIREYYRSSPKAFPPDENGEWQPHWVFVGEVIKSVESEKTPARSG